MKRGLQINKYPMNSSGMELVKGYTDPEDYFSLVCVSKEFHEIFKSMKGPVMLRRLFREHGIDRFTAKEFKGPELLLVLSRIFDDVKPSRYHAEYIRNLVTDLKFDGLY